MINTFSRYRRKADKLAAEVEKIRGEKEKAEKDREEAKIFLVSFVLDLIGRGVDEETALGRIPEAFREDVKALIQGAAPA